MTKVISATNAKNNFSDILNHVHYSNEDFIVERNGEKVALIIPLADAALTKEKAEKLGKLFGVISDKEATKLKKIAKEFRKPFKLLPHP